MVGEVTRVLITIGILIIGFGLMKLFSRILIKVRRAARTDVSMDSKPFSSVFEKMFFGLVLLIALFFLGFGSLRDYIYNILDSLPGLLLMILLIILGVMLVQLISWLIEKFVMYTKLQEIVTDELSSNLIPVLLLFVKIVLYITLVEVTVNFIDVPGIAAIANFILYPMIILVFLLFFVAMINPMRDLASGYYLKNIWRFKPGNAITFDRRKFTIKEIQRFSSELVSDKGNYLVIPNRILAGKGLEFERPSKEIATLEDIKDKYVAQLPSMCGPASAQIALSFFDIKTTQEEMAREMGTIVRIREDQVAGTHPENLIKAVSKVSHGRVLGAWVGFEKIYNLRNEVTTWLSEGAILIADYKKKYLFPNALRAHYSLIVGVRGDEFLMIDPSGKKGGVYFSDYRDVIVGMDTMSEMIKGKRGYIVLAPKGTAAYQRIKEGLIYYHPSAYDKISKALETKLHKFTSAPALMELLPPTISKHLKKYEREQVRRVWRP